MLQRLPLVAVPLLMAAGLLGHGLIGMLRYGAVTLAVIFAARLVLTTSIERISRRARRLERTPMMINSLAQRAGIGRPTVYALPNATDIFTTGWLRSTPALFVPQSWISKTGDLAHDAVGAVAHELAHVRARDFLWKQVAQLGAIFLLSLSIVSPLGAFMPEVFGALSLEELGFVVIIPMISWVAATQYSTVIRWLELRADRNAIAVCGAACLEQSIRRHSADRHSSIFSTHPTAMERLKALRGLR